MPHIRLTISRFVPAACLLIFVSGCAVTRIDVDVYKGPMANHSDVQAEQLAALAMGARPLLIELRDKLDRITVNREGAISIDGEKAQTKIAYTDFIPTPAPREGSGAYLQGRQWLINQQAIQINAILSLYRDQTD